MGAAEGCGALCLHDAEQRDTCERRCTMMLLDDPARVIPPAERKSHDHACGEAIAPWSLRQRSGGHEWQEFTRHGINSSYPKS